MVDCGALNEWDWSRSGGDCEGISWSMAAAITANGTSSEDWDQIDENGTNIWKFSSHFMDRAGDDLSDSCGVYPSDGAIPYGFEYRIEIGSDEDPGELFFQSWEPEDGDGDSTNDELGLTLDILGTAAGTVAGPYASIGKALIQYSMDGSGTTVTSENLDSKLNFDVPVTGDHEDLPHESSGEIKAAEVSVRVKNEYSSGSHMIKFRPSYTFGYRTAANCVCHSDYVYTRYKTTAPDTDLYGFYDVA